MVADLNVGDIRTYRCNSTETLVSNDSWCRRAPEVPTHEEKVMQI